MLRPLRAVPVRSGSRRPFRWSCVPVLLAALPVALAGCSVVSDWVSPPEQPARLSSTADKVGADTEFPNLASVPDAPPQVTPPEKSRAIMEGLIADRANAEYTDQTLHPGATQSLTQLSEAPEIFTIAPQAGVESAPATEALPPDDGAATEETPEAGMPEAAGSDTASAEIAEARPGGQTPSVGPGSQAAAAAEPQAEVAALPQAADVDAGARVFFDEGSAELSDSARSELVAVADRLLQDGDARVQLRAYADGNGDGSSSARRLSLSRAIAVRRFLIDQGVPSSRMDVRALGDQVEDKPADRVDVLIAAR